ncbi:hypothetical protein BDP27DRAFT_1436285 [Rhodocollybia butyracea]|uniref:Uncharacterized protein n=1 Tax=Rhodocollybia butyracea TaxID=206335 RepID=A0A9P5P5G0_9AGAR|nr:hypothetical protein BDP27DRAFT_1436285 [Rhodocollybia butyracea]
MAKVLSNDFEYHDLSPISPLQDSPWAREVASSSTVCTSSLVVQNKEQYLQWYAKGWYDMVYSRTVEVHQRIEAGNFIITDATTEYKLKKSPRVFQSRWLLIYEFESPTVDSFSPPSSSAEPEIGTIRRIKGMNHSAKVIQNGILANVDDEVENGRWKGQKLTLKFLNRCCGLTAGAVLGFDDSQLKYSPPKTAPAKRSKEGSQEGTGKDDIIIRSSAKCQDLEKSPPIERGVQKSEREVRGRIYRLLHFFH